MLSRTAENLYWMSRYIERAETTARLLQVGARNALLPDIGGGFRNDWEAILQATGSLHAFRDKYGETRQRNIETFMFFDTDNPSSVASCLAMARENARVVRTALEQLGRQVGARVDAAVVARELGLVRPRAGLGVGVGVRVGVQVRVTLVILFLIWLECASVLSMITSRDTGGRYREG